MSEGSFKGAILFFLSCLTYKNPRSNKCFFFCTCRRSLGLLKIALPTSVLLSFSFTHSLFYFVSSLSCSFNGTKRNVTFPANNKQAKPHQCTVSDKPFESVCLPFYVFHCQSPSFLLSSLSLLISFSFRTGYASHVLTGSSCHIS